MKGVANTWLPDELAWIEAHKHWPRKDLHSEFVTVWNRPDINLRALIGLCKRRGWFTGRSGQYEKGNVPDTKGAAGFLHPNSIATRFAKGITPTNRVPLGTERISQGYIEIKVNQRNPHTGYDTRFVQKHRWLWEQANGPVPAGHCLKSLDGNKLNTDPANWVCIPRALLPRLNGRFGRDYDVAPDDLKPVILTIAKLEHAAREARKAASQ